MKLEGLSKTNKEEMRIVSIQKGSTKTGKDFTGPERQSQLKSALQIGKGRPDTSNN